MKKVLVTIFSLLMIGNVVACPNLAGTYRCHVSDLSLNLPDYNLDLSQNGTIFTSSIDGGPSESVIADGVLREFDIDGFSGSLKTFCSGDALVVDYNTQVVSEGVTIETSGHTTKRKSGSVLTEISEITVYGQVYSIITSVCNEI